MFEDFSVSISFIHSDSQTRYGRLDDSFLLLFTVRPIGLVYKEYVSNFTTLSYLLDHRVIQITNSYLIIE
jgi:hypothetical protein